MLACLLQIRLFILNSLLY